MYYKKGVRVTGILVICFLVCIFGSLYSSAIGGIYPTVIQEDGSVYTNKDQSGNKNSNQGQYQYGGQFGTQVQNNQTISATEPVKADAIIDESFNNETIYIKENSWLQIELPGNGNQWEPHWNDSLFFLSDHYILPSPTNAVGADGTEVWLFGAHSSGKSAITFNLVYQPDLDDESPRIITFIIDIYSDTIQPDRNASSFVSYYQEDHSTNEQPIRSQHSSMTNQATISNAGTYSQWGAMPTVAYNNRYNYSSPQSAPVLNTGYSPPGISLGLAPAALSGAILNTYASTANNISTNTANNTTNRSAASYSTANNNATASTSYNTIRTSTINNTQYAPSLPTQALQGGINSLLSQSYQFGIAPIMPSFSVMNPLMFMRMF